MKTNRLELKTSDEDEKILKKAAEKFEKETGTKGMKSRAILAAVEHYTRPEPILIFENLKALNEIDANIEFSKFHLQKIVDEYFAIANEVPTIEEIQSLFGVGNRNFLVCDFEALKEQIFNKLHNQLQRKHIDLVVIRTNIPVPNFDKLVGACKELINAPCVNIYEVFYWQCYLIRDSKIVLLDDQIEKIRSFYQSFAATTDEIRRLNDVQNLCNTMNSIFLPNVSSGLKLMIPGFINFDPILGMVPGNIYVKYQL